MSIPKSHPRYTSLKIRNLIVAGIENGITSMHGLIAHGRGEAFDYLLGEKTQDFARNAIRVASALLLLAKHPVISVNGNSSALSAKELVLLAKQIPAPLEVNLFHSSKTREKKIKDHLIKNGAFEVLLPSKHRTINFLESNRKFVHKDGISQADVVFVSLEDGDRIEALIKNNKKVITIDLNPLSRTAQKANVTIVDNIMRAIPLIIASINEVKKYNKEQLEKIIKEYDNKKNLGKALRTIKQNLQ